MFQEAFDEPLVEIGKAKERLHFFLVRWSGPFSNTCNLDRVHRDGVVGDDHSKVLDRSLLELALVRAWVQLVLL